MASLGNHNIILFEEASRFKQKMPAKNVYIEIADRDIYSTHD